MSSPAAILRERIRQSVADKDTGSLASIIGSAIDGTGRRTRKDRIREVNMALAESAIETGRPDLLDRFYEIPYDTFRTLLPGLVDQYVRTRDNAWFDAIAAAIGRLGKKGDRSDLLARMCRTLITEGIARQDRLFIEQGMALFKDITFRKYQSGVLIRVSPALTDWAVSQGDDSFLRALHGLSGGIADISKKSVIHARLAVAIAAIGTERDDPATWAEGVRIAAGIRQKNRRQDCIRAIVQNLAPSPLFIKIRDIPITAGALAGVPEEALHEVIAAILAEVLAGDQDHAGARDQIGRFLAEVPAAGPTVVAVLLRHAGETGDSWFFSEAMATCKGAAGKNYPAHEFVEAALAILRATGDTGPLRQVIPAVASGSSPAAASRVLLRIVHVLLAEGELTEALSVFLQSRKGSGDNPRYDDCSTAIFRYAIANDAVTEVTKILRIAPGDLQWSGAIERAVFEICRQHAFTEISARADAISAAMDLHPERDQVVLDCITTLIHRGFLETADPDVLIRLTRSIGDGGTREQALSTIVIRVAKLGVATKSRDFLQRAVGLSCLIDDARTRSLTLTAVIDEATVLAVADGDLGLLRRMREWSSSLLSRDGEIIASSNIIEGMITYAADRRYPPALDEAYEVAREIADPSMRDEILQRICESYVRIGCLVVQDLQDQPESGEYRAAFRLFLQGYELLAGRDRPEEQSLRIARIIDIILDFSKDRFRTDLLPALVLFAIEIRQPFERDAMTARIASLLRTASGLPDSTDPYESIVEVLLQIRYVPEDPALLGLALRTAGQVKDAFSRSLRLASIAGLYLQAGSVPEAQSLLDSICGSAGEVAGEYRQVILLSECTGYYTGISEDAARSTLRSALALLRPAIYDPESTAARHLIGTIARFFAAYPDDGLLAAAQEIASRIGDPAEFAAALLPVYRMAAGRPEVRRAVVQQVRKTAGDGMIPVRRTPLLLDLAREMATDGEPQDLTDLLADAEKAASLVRIPFLADVFRGRIAGLYVALYRRTGTQACISRAAAVFTGIENDQVRSGVAVLHDTFSGGDPSPLAEIRELAGRMVAEQYSPAHAIGLDNMIRSVHDRSQIARTFCTVSIFFNSTGRTRLARRYYEIALNEAGVIRPLSRRAFILCDLALALDSAGCPANAQDVMDAAVNAATGIRQYTERDEVFDELAAAMRWMREEGAA